MKRVLCLALIGTLISCERFAVSSAPPPEVVSDTQKNQRRLYDRPAAEISLSEITAYSCFYCRSASTQELLSFSRAEQTDCKTLKLRTASGKSLTFNILESSDRYLKFKLSQDFGDKVPNYQRDALFKRYQPDEILIQIVSETDVKIEKKVRSFDPLCKKKSESII
ncbi:MAG: hypothetical protein JNL11_07345 [Bdellovibrionaceae bacterium]|nr:hypothetical protein [Pseudobdellovibrionaceae bacterium]